MATTTSSTALLRLFLSRRAAGTAIGCSSSRAAIVPLGSESIAAVSPAFAQQQQQRRQYRLSGVDRREDEKHQQHQQQWRGAASASVSSDAQPVASAAKAEQDPASDKEVVYRGALGPSLRRLKLVSLANTAVALAASPALSWLSNNAPEGTTAAAYARAATVAATAAGFGVLTTLGLHWFTKPYVHEIVRVREGGEDGGLEEQHLYRLRSLSPLGRPVWRPLDASAVRAADVARPLATFCDAEGRVYYVDAAGFAEGEDALREALMPLSAAEQAAMVAAAEAAEVVEEQEQQEQQGHQEEEHQHQLQHDGETRR
jgi:hypothetical protein